MRTWAVRIALTGLCVAATVGMLGSIGSAAAKPHKKPVCAHSKAGAHTNAACRPRQAKPHGKTEPHATACPVSAIDGVCPATWMHDLAPYIGDRKLGQIVIPGAHDSATYSLPPPGDDLWHTQSDDLIGQLNDGMRQFDLRVEWDYAKPANGNHADYYAHHGSGTTDGISRWLTLSRIFSDIATWAKTPGHQQEVLLINLSITENGRPFPEADCSSFGHQMGDALVTPLGFDYWFGTVDPGAVPLDWIWQLPDPNGYARVILDDTDSNPDSVINRCLSDATHGSQDWVGWAPSGGYYADQCTAGGQGPPPNSSSKHTQWYGIKNMDLGNPAVSLPGSGSGRGAVQIRANVGSGPGTPTSIGDPQVGGLWNLGVMGTPAIGLFDQGDCIRTPWDMVPDEREVLAALYQQWQTDPATKANLNIISGDFVQDTDLMKDVIAMDRSFAPELYKITPTGSTAVTAEQDENLPASSFGVLVTTGSRPIPGVKVTYTFHPNNVYCFGPTVNGVPVDGRDVTFSETTDENGEAQLPGVNVGPNVTFCNVTASVPETSTDAKWELQIQTASKYTLRPGPYNETTLKVGEESGEFDVSAVDGAGNVVVGVPITLDAGSAGTWISNGSNTITVTTGIAGDLRAGNHAGKFLITVTAPNAPPLYLPLTVTGPPGAPIITNLGNGDGQVSVGFSDADPGTSPITAYEAKATDQSKPNTAPVTATGPRSPITVTGLTNGDTYQFTVTATSADGTSPPSAASGWLNVGVAPVIVSGPANGVLGQPYASGFKVTGAPVPTVTQVSGDLPPGLTLHSDGTLTGTPTKADDYEFTVEAVNPVGIYAATVTVTISPATLGGRPPTATGRQVHATVCVLERRPGKPAACAERTLTGRFSPLATDASATLTRGSVIYATGHTNARDRKLTLYRRRALPAGSYTLILRRPHRAIIVTVTVR